jgi:hypothetical protein
MTDRINNGTRRDIGGKPCVYYDGYWIKYYDPPEDTLETKKALIDALTRRLFNHTEHGINVPGQRLDEVKQAYETEQDPARKRVKGAMVAGAYFNRAADIFRKAVELQECGVEIDENNVLMQECGRCLIEALSYGKTVRHRHGDEGIDELWGEPFKAFTMPIEDFYDSRYIKIAQVMHDVDELAEAISDCLSQSSMFQGIGNLIRAFADAAKLKCETLRTDPAIFEVWPSFAVAREQLLDFEPRLPPHPSMLDTQMARDAQALLAAGVQLIGDITRARVAMPKSKREFLERCERLRQALRSPGSAA